jgi:PAS domain S-box-containing protein
VDWSEIRFKQTKSGAAPLMKKRETNARESSITSPIRRWPGYTVAVAGPILAAVVRWALVRTVGDLPLYLTFYPPVFAAALVGGTGPGTLATFICAFLADLFFIEPVGRLDLGTAGQSVGMGFFVATNVAISILGGRFRKQSASLKQTESRLRHFIEQAPVAIAMLDTQMRYLAASRRWLATFSLSNQDILGRSHYEVFPDIPERWKQVHQRCLAGAVESANEDLFERADGSRQWLRWEIQPWYAGAGSIGGLVIFTEDITARLLTEEALRQSEERFRTMANAIPQMAWIARPDGYMFWFNRRCYEYSGVTLEQLEGWGWVRVVDPEQLPEVLERWRRSLATGEPYDTQSRLRAEDGRFHPFLTRIVPLKDKEGKVVLWFGTHTDISELQEAQEALRQSEERFRTMANGIPQLAWMARPDGYRFWYNRRWFEYTGTTQEQMEGWGWQSVHDPQLKLLEEWRRRLANSQPFEMESSLRGADGRFRPFLTRVMPLKDPEGRLMLWFGTSTDITELRERERTLGRQARLIDLAPAATFVKRDDGTITFWSRGAEQLYGWSKEEAIGRNVHCLLRTEFPEPLESILAKVAAGCAWTGELRHTTRDGHPVIVQSYWLSEPNAHGGMQETLESNTDITERKRLQDHLEEAVYERTAELHDAISELEYMSYSMVHDMRAPLRAMQSFAGMMQREYGGALPPAGLDYLDRIREASNRLDRLITDALNYNKVVRENLPVTAVDLGGLLRGMVQTYPNLHPPGADITVELGELMVIGNESLLTQCFGNILDNAVKFVAPGVAPRVRVWAELVDGRELMDQPSPPGHAPSRSGDQPSTTNPRSVRVWVEDNGIGIPKDAREKIFQMFHRMHAESEYPGTGIGLAIVRKAVQRMSGKMGLESEPGRGSKFWVELPTAIQAQTQDPLQRAA